jgi:RimJ/RimL family protein N-acetyltransferase
MSLLHWIDINKLDLYNLSFNPKSIKYLEKNPDKINWDALSLNPNAIKILEKNQDIGLIYH